MFSFPLLLPAQHTCLAAQIFIHQIHQLAAVTAAAVEAAVVLVAAAPARGAAFRECAPALEHLLAAVAVFCTGP